MLKRGERKLSGQGRKKAQEANKLKKGYFQKVDEALLAQLQKIESTPQYVKFLNFLSGRNKDELLWMGVGGTCLLFAPFIIFLIIVLSQNSGLNREVELKTQIGRYGQGILDFNKQIKGLKGRLAGKSILKKSDLERALTYPLTQSKIPKESLDILSFNVRDGRGNFQKIVSRIKLKNIGLADFTDFTQKLAAQNIKVSAVELVKNKQETLDGNLSIVLVSSLGDKKKK